jgi:hypothetical protein
MACIWYDKTSHSILECFNARRFAVDARKKLLKQQGRF